MSSDENDERLIMNVGELMHTVTGLTSDLDKVTRWAREASRALDIVTKQYADSSDSDKTLVGTLETIKGQLGKAAEAKDSGFLVFCSKYALHKASDNDIIPAWVSPLEQS